MTEVDWAIRRALADISRGLQTLSQLRNGERKKFKDSVDCIELRRMLQDYLDNDQHEPVDWGV